MLLRQLNLFFQKKSYPADPSKYTSEGERLMKGKKRKRKGRKEEKGKEKSKERKKQGYFNEERGCATQETLPFGIRRKAPQTGGCLQAIVRTQSFHF